MKSEIPAPPRRPRLNQHGAALRQERIFERGLLMTVARAGGKALARKRTAKFPWIRP